MARLEQIRFPVHVASITAISVACLAGCSASMSDRPHGDGSGMHQREQLAGVKSEHIFKGVGDVRRPITTSSRAAQRFFNQGLSFVYAFNHDEAVRAFERAAENDPKCAMAYWGKALALGPNINLDVDPERERMAYEAVQKALSLSDGASEREKDYIKALSVRYSIDPKADLKKLAADYSKEMRKLSQKYPDDLDAAVLFAESGMNLRPWALWDKAGRPEEGTEEIVATLESVLKRDPCHPGANHYYIHAVEASPNPERALASAERLPHLAPNAGHLVHMPAHIYIRLGEYEKAAASNREAVRVDEAYLARTNAQGFYPMMYYNHNLHFLAVASAIGGRYDEALAAAEKMAVNAKEGAKHMPMLDPFAGVPLVVRIMFERWDDILTQKEPEKFLPVTRALWHYGRGLAFVANGSVGRAEKELLSLQKIKGSIDKSLVYGSPYNPARDVLEIPALQLKAAIAERRGKLETADALLREAIKREDALAYNEPEDWLLSSRLTLGKLALKRNQPGLAEATFRDELARRPQGGRALFGLAESLRAQDKPEEATRTENAFKQAWTNADTVLVSDRRQ